MSGLAISRGLGVRRSLRAMKKIDCELRARRGGEDRALVVLQYLDPRRDVSSVILAGLGCQVEVGGQERGAKLRDLS